jgi:hypothetical protein
LAQRRREPFRRTSASDTASARCVVPSVMSVASMAITALPGIRPRFMNEAPDSNVARRGKYSPLLTIVAVTGGFVQNCTLSQPSLVRGNDARDGRDAIDPTETWAAPDLRSAKALFVPWSGVISYIAWACPRGRVTWLFPPDDGNLYSHWAARRSPGRSQRERSRRRCLRSDFCIRRQCEITNCS